MAEHVEGGHTWKHEEGKTVWVPDKEEGFALATFKSEDDGVAVVEVAGADTRFKSHVVYPINPDSQIGVPDNTRLMYLHDPHLLDNVRHRFLQNDIYTYTAHILIVVNPYRLFPELYSPDTVAQYRGKPIGTLPPHVFAIADRAYRHMIVDKTSQGIIVSGESGAGKTETSKHVMAYLAAVGGMEGGMGKLERQILEANPILEAFGNAKTLRNNNSSRFGKFTKIDFDDKGKIIGATIDTYLLEKSRLLFQAKGERNYHIFYQMLRGLGRDELAEFKLGPPEKYHYLRQGGDTLIQGVDDGKNFDRVVKGLDLIGVDSTRRKQIWRLLAGLLHLGNVLFEESEDDDDSAQVVDLDVLETAAEMLQVDILKLRTGLLFRSISAGRSDESFEVPLTVQQAQYSRDSLASLIYSHLFDHVVTNINASLRLQKHGGGGKELFIGVLDIYGFEVFQRNSFEQLTINYANEKVHQYFIKNTFKEEQEIYNREAIPCPEIKYQDNQDALNMLEDKKRGIFAMIDDEGKKPKASDTNLLANLHTAHRSKTKRWVKPANARAADGQKVTDKEAFVFRHFAGEVCYHIKGFLDKNTLQITVDAELVITTSQHPLFPILFPELFEQKKSKRRSNNTASSQFLTQLNALMEVLNATTPSFVRCVKPNAEQVPGKFTGSMCLEQLRCSGMLEALSLMQIGYPTRCPYSDLYDMYVKQMPEAIRHLPASQFVEAILMALELDRDQFALGVTRVFFKAGQLAFLEQLTGRDMSEGGVDIVAKVKKWLVKKRWHKAISVAKTCVKLMKMNVGMLHFKRFRKAAKLMVLINTTVLRRAREIKHRNAAITLQCAGRRRGARRAFVGLRDSVTLVQAQWRMMGDRKPHLKELQEKRMRAKIEEELRKKEEAAEKKKGLLPSGPGPDPYAALAKRTPRKRKTDKENEEANIEAQKEKDEKEAEAEKEKAKAQKQLEDMQQQMKSMQEAMMGGNVPMGMGAGVGAGPEGADGAHHKQMVFRRSSGVMMMGEDVDARLRKIEAYLERLPDIDENILDIVHHLTGKRPEKRPPPQKEGPEQALSLPDAAAPQEGSVQAQEGAEAAKADDAQPAQPQAEGEEEVQAVNKSAPPPADAAAAAGAAAAAAAAPAAGGKAVGVATLSQEHMNTLLQNSPLMLQLEQMQQLMLQSLAMAQGQGDVLSDMAMRRVEEESARSEMLVRLQTQTKEMEDMLIKARVDIEVKAAENSALEDQIKALRQEIVDMKSERSALLEERDGLATNLASAQATSAGAAAKLAEKEQENSDLRDKVTDLAEQLATLKRSVKELIQIRTRNLQKQHKAGGTGAVVKGDRRMSARPASVRMGFSSSTPTPRKVPGRPTAASMSESMPSTPPSTPPARSNVHPEA